MPCPYANLFGVPGEGFHAQRIFGVAANDLVGTLALAGLTSATFPRISFFRATLSWFVAAEIFHYALGVRTALLEKLGLKPSTCDTSPAQPLSPPS